MSSLQDLQDELLKVKNHYGNQLKLKKAQKKSKNYPFPISVRCGLYGSSRASSIDVDIVTIEVVLEAQILNINAATLADSDFSSSGVSVVIHLDQGTPKQLNDQIEDQILKFWGKTIKQIQQQENKGGVSKFCILEIFSFFEQNMFELLTCVPSLIETYEGTDENGVSIRRYVILQPELEVVPVIKQVQDENKQIQIMEKQESENLSFNLLEDEMLQLVTWLVRTYEADVKVFDVDGDGPRYGVKYNLNLQPTDPSWPSSDTISEGIRINGTAVKNDEVQVLILYDQNKHLSTELVNVLNKALARYTNQQQQKNLRMMLKFLENYAGQFYTMVQELEQNKISTNNDDEKSSDFEDTDENSEYSDDSNSDSDSNSNSGSEQLSIEEAEDDVEFENVNVEGKQTQFSMRLQSLKLDNVDTVQALQIRLQVACNRCGQSYQMNFNSSAIDSSISSSSKSQSDSSVEVSVECDHCHVPTVAKCTFKLIHEFNDEIARISCVGCFPVDLLPSMTAVQCTECGQQVVLRDTQVGQSNQKECRSCHKKCEVQFQSVLFQPVIKDEQQRKKKQQNQQRQKRESSGGKKTPYYNGVLKVGEPLPATGTCKHYQHSHKWYRFPCCGQRFPCDLCHEEHTDGHEMKWANRIVCGYCSYEQPLTKICIQCNKKLATGAGNPTGRNTRFWEGGKGCRDPRRMHGKDPHKYKNSKFKTRSKKQSRVGQEGSVRRQRAAARRNEASQND